jgi:hypothetical protein
MPMQHNAPNGPDRGIIRGTGKILAPDFPIPKSSTMGRFGTRQTRNSPFMLGVSGHRDLDPADLPRLREAVAGFVRQLRDFLPNTDIHLTVGMAAGADLLVAQTALDLGLQVEAVLPMPLQQYAVDFEGESLASLRSLLEQPDVRCVELSRGSRLFDHGALSATERDEMYAKLTQTLIRRTSLLLALWDGRSSRLAGGTADTVLRYLGVRTDEVDASSDIEFQVAKEEPGIGTRLVYWTPTARSGNPDKEESALAPGYGTPCYLSGLGDAGLQAHLQMPAILKEQLSELDDYNLDYVRLNAAEKLQKPDSIMAKLPFRDSVPDLPTLRDIDEQYGKADALAVHYHRLSDRLINLFGVVAIIMSFVFLIYERIVQSRLLLIAYVVTLLSGLAAYYLLKIRHWFGKHLTYRALAETLRARFYLRLADADYRVDAAEVLSLSGIELFEGFSWIGFVLKGIEPADIHPAASQDKDSDEARWVEQVWIESQHQYFTAKVLALEDSSRRVKHLRYSIFAAILLVIAVLIVFAAALDGIRLAFGVTLKNLLTFVVGLLAILVGAWELHQTKMAARELLWQYRNQLKHISRAQARLLRVTSVRRRKEVLADLGKESLMECYMWAMHRFHREQEPPRPAGAQ